ncbi:hypothetical protein [Actibacterium sp. MT2.3-13A]|uniref:hypothetical protein n=1 Tax=Actibacterium sp. MT2.3-13A TaxID=2828332 RepID=UPI001BAA76A5|nr:hypothetical protein [Actibacterium sp. MT2.3-13A]
MSLIRPELRRAFWRWREVLIGLGVALAGLWLFTRGGLFFQGIGLIVGAAGAGLALVALRRVRFRRPASAPGYVEVMEGQISYLAPETGGFAALSELTEVRLIDTAQGRAWRLAQAGAPALAIPVDAARAELLFDVFAALPGAEPARILAALDAPVPPGGITVWRRANRMALT